ncbi:MAG TPA: retroviral-like aspartic protease family protein [Sphingomicrobium sp.]|nr:retroviral-like aspartic protease family protein [Sphingomicrobium sp.]
MALSALLLAGVAGDGLTAATPPKISKPRPAPPDLKPDVPPLPPAIIDPTLAVGGDEVEAKKIETRLSVEVQVNGRGPYRFIVDSGADTSVVGLKIARELELPLGTPAILNGMTSRDIVDRVKVAELSFGPTTVRDLELPALREEDVGGEGMIGIDALVQQRLLMDFEDRLIKVEDARVRYRPQPGEIVVTARRYRGQLILTHVRAAGLPLDAVIDTGTQVTIGNLALRDKLIKGNRDKFVTIPIIGVTGVRAELQMAKIGELQIGPINIANVPIAFADVPPFKLFGLADQPALLIGTDLLEVFRRVSLDFKARKARFQLRKCKSEGVILSTDPNNFSRLSSTGTYDVCGR